MNSDRSDTTIGLPVLDSEDLDEQGNLPVVVLVKVARVRDQVDHVCRFVIGAMCFNSAYFHYSFLCNRLKFSVSKKATETRYPPLSCLLEVPVLLFFSTSPTAFAPLLDSHWCGFFLRRTKQWFNWTACIAFVAVAAMWIHRTSSASVGGVFF